MPEEKLLSVRLDEKPACELTTHWEESDGAAKIVRYGGTDGYLYESVTPEAGSTSWIRLEPISS